MNKLAKEIGIALEACRLIAASVGIAKLKGNDLIMAASGLYVARSEANGAVQAIFEELSKGGITPQEVEAAFLTVKAARESADLATRMLDKVAGY